MAEGVPNTLSVYEIARELDVRTPLIDAVYSVLYESKPPMEALAELMTRDPGRSQIDFLFFELLFLDKLYYINNQYETCHHLSSFCRRRPWRRQCGHSGSPASEYTPTRKLGRAIANLIYSVEEIPLGIINWTSREGIMPVFP